MIPIAEKSMPSFNDKDYLGILVNTLQMSVPAAYFWLLMFYMFFHSYLNLWAELTRFGDRRFYSDWWNAGNLNEYWRKWNFPIHSYLIRHVYYPLRRRRYSAIFSVTVTFLVSAIFHEYIVIGIFHIYNGIAFSLMAICVPIMYI